VEGRPFADPAFDPYLAAVKINEVLADRQPKAAASRLVLV